MQVQRQKLDELLLDVLPGSRQQGLQQAFATKLGKIIPEPELQELHMIAPP